MNNEPRMQLADPPPCPGWLLALRHWRNRAWRGWRRFISGCTRAHDPHLMKELVGEALVLSCPRCHLEVKRVLPEQEPRVRPWDEKAYQWSKSRHDLGDRLRRFTK